MPWRIFMRYADALCRLALNINNILAIARFHLSDYHFIDKNYHIKFDYIIIMFIFVAKPGDYNTTTSGIYLSIESFSLFWQDDNSNKMANLTN